MRVLSLYRCRPTDPQTALRLILALSCGVLLGLPFLFPSLFGLTWVALVPLLISLRGTHFRQAYILGLVAGIALSVITTYWIDEFIVNLKGYAWPLRIALAGVFWVFSAHILAVLAVLSVASEKLSRVSPYLVFPPLLTLVFAFYPSMFPVQLGASQSRFLIALQGIEFTGVYGLDFMIGLSNVLFFTVLNKIQGHKIGSILAAIMLAGWFSYGAFSLHSWDNTSAEQPTISVGIVQPNELHSIEPTAPVPGYSYAYPIEMALSDALVNSGAELVVWPETRHRGYFAYPHVAEAFHLYVKRSSVPLIFQDNETHVVDAKIKRFNSSVFIDNSGRRASTYRKMKRIPFGEYMPLFNEMPAVKQHLRHFLGDFFSDLKAGDQPIQYRVDGLQPDHQDAPTLLIPLICYELIFPRFVATAIPVDSAPKILLGQSNNAWFGDTRQPFQHLTTSILRSVENRLPLIHVMNNGPSAVVLPNGRAIAQAPYRQAGGYLVSLPLADSAIKTLFARFPMWFLFASGIMLLLALFSSYPKIASQQF